MTDRTWLDAGLVNASHADWWGDEQLQLDVNQDSCQDQDNQEHFTNTNQTETLKWPEEMFIKGKFKPHKQRKRCFNSWHCVSVQDILSLICWTEDNILVTHQLYQYHQLVFLLHGDHQFGWVGSTLSDSPTSKLILKLHISYFSWQFERVHSQSWCSRVFVPPSSCQHWLFYLLMSIDIEHRFQTSYNTGLKRREMPDWRKPHWRKSYLTEEWSLFRKYHSMMWRTTDTLTRYVSASKRGYSCAYCSHASINNCLQTFRDKKRSAGWKYEKKLERFTAGLSQTSQHAAAWMGISALKEHCYIPVNARKT